MATSLPLSLISCSSSSSSSMKTKPRTNSFLHIVQNDIAKRFDWSSNVRLQKLAKGFDDLFWLKNFEDPSAAAEPRPSWPRPSYSGLFGVDLLIADLNALKEYSNYFRNASRVWCMPLPETYDPEQVAEYFSYRPHVLALRVLEVISSFASAVIKMRSSGIFKFHKFGMDGDESRNQSSYFTGEILKETLLNLGPTFVKVGQSLSTRPDIIGSEICQVLSELHDKVPPFPRPVAMEIIEEELGCSVDQAFSFLSEEPVAAASFGQVYHGRTLDGCAVAVKVLRPNLRHAVVRDIYILRLGLGLLRKIAKRKSDIRLYADELGKGFVGELDYTLEAQNATEFQEAHAHYPFISVPKIFWHLSRKRVLTMEWMVGENPNDLLLLSRGLSDHGALFSEQHQSDARKKLLDLVNKGVEASLVQLLQTGLMHADPHPGNLRYTPMGQIGFLDFGLLCRMEKKHQLAMLASILHIVNGDWSALVLDLSQMDIIRPGTDIRRVTLELENSLGEVSFEDGIPDIKFSRVLGKIWSLALKYHFRLPPYYTLVLRSLASLEGLAVAADPGFKTFEAAYPYVVQKLLADNSASMRRILHSVVFNKQKEFQWKKLALFLKIGAAKYRTSADMLFSSEYDTCPEYGAATEKNNISEVANLVLRLLPSKDGVVLRRLLITADPASLVQVFVSPEAISIREHVGEAIADFLYQWTTRSLLGIRNHKTMHQHGSRVSAANTQQGGEMVVSSESSIQMYRVFLRDRRLKVILYRIMNNVARYPLLMIKFCLTCCAIFISASAQACHRLLVSWSERFVTSISVAPWQLAISR